MQETLWSALALVLVIEGILPFLAPGLWRDAFRRLTNLTDGQLRYMGLIAMVFGLVGLWLLN